MGLYRVKNQWGGSAARWHKGGRWIIGSRPKQNVVALNIRSKDGGKTLTGTMTYKGEGPIRFSATKESNETNAGFSNPVLERRVKQLEAELKTQKEQYQKIIDQQKKSYAESIKKLKNVTESETKSTILAAINAAKVQAQQAEADTLLAGQKQRRAEVLSMLTSKILDLNKTEDQTKVLQEAIESLAQEASKITSKIARSPVDSTMALNAQNYAQQAIDLATQAEEHLTNIQEKQASAQVILEAQKQNLEQLDVESNNEEQKSSEVLDAAALELKQLEATGGSLAEISQHHEAAIESQEEAELALLLAIQQAKLASEAYDNWEAVEDMFGFSEPDENSADSSETEGSDNLPDALPDTFPDYDNWQVIGDLFGIPATPEATPTESTATESSNL